MKRRKIVLFLGAGFSRAFGLPVMTEFTDFVRGHDRVDQAHAAVLNQVIKDARQANSFMLSDPKNIEDMLSFAEMTDRLELNKDLSRADHIRRLLGAVYASAPTDSDRANAARSFSTLIEYEADEQQRAVRGFSPEGLSIVTTNYDLSPEYMLQSIGCTVTLGSAATKSPFNISGRDLYSPENPGSVRICRLHGAVNWFAGESQTVLVDGFIGEGGHPQICNFATDHGRVPLIIPPSFLKPQLSEAMRSVWAEAARRLSEADDIIFIGYSFPPTDTEMAYFLAAALWPNTGLSRILIVDPNATQIVERLKSGRFGNHFTSLIRAVPSAWQNAGKLDIPVTWATRDPPKLPRQRH